MPSSARPFETMSSVVTSYQEDVYNPREAEEVMKRWVKDGGTLPGR
jgi:hypothetical protein